MIDPTTLRWEAYNSFGLQAGFNDADEIVLYRTQTNKTGEYVYSYDAQTIDDLINKDLPVYDEIEDLYEAIRNNQMALNDEYKGGGFFHYVDQDDVDNASGGDDMSFSSSDSEDTLQLTSIYGNSEIEVSVNDATYTPYLTTNGFNFTSSKIDVRDRVLPVGYYKFRNRANGPRPVGPVYQSPAFTKDSVVNLWDGYLWAALGTSITADGVYADKLATMLNLSLVNLGVSGGSLSTSSPILGGAIYNQVQNIPEDAGLVTFEVGINDFRTNAILGTIADTTLATFYGALRKAVNDARDVAPNAAIIFFIPYGNTDTYFQGNWNTPNNNGDTLGQFQQAIRDVSIELDCYVIEIAENSGIGTDQGDFYLTDGIHLNENGGFKYADYCYRNIRQYQFDDNRVLKPIIQPSTGYYVSEIEVSISTLTSGASIYYTTDGSTPTTSSSLYSSPFNVSTNTTVKAIAVKSGLSNSIVATNQFSFDSELIDNGTWSDFTEMGDSDISGINCTAVKSGTLVNGTSIVNGTYGGLVINGGRSAVEFELQGGNENCWFMLCAGSAGFWAVGDPGTPGVNQGYFATTGRFTAATGNVGGIGSVPSNQRAAIIGVPSGRRFRIGRFGDLVLITSLLDGSWVVNLKINIPTEVKTDGYGNDVKFGLLVEAGRVGAQNVKVGTYTIP